MNFDDLNILQKFCDNRMDYQQFKEATGYSDLGSYAQDIWDDFSKNPIRFITSRSERDLLQYILNKIESTNYKG